MSTKKILDARAKTHGSFAENARISQALKAVMESGSYEKLPDTHREALDMIALKLSRILSGQHNYRDHFDDIAGYATLVAEELDA